MDVGVFFKGRTEQANPLTRKADGLFTAKENFAHTLGAVLNQTNSMTENSSNVNAQEEKIQNLLQIINTDHIDQITHSGIENTMDGGLPNLEEIAKLLGSRLEDVKKSITSLLEKLSSHFSDKNIKQKDLAEIDLSDLFQVVQLIAITPQQEFANLSLHSVEDVLKVAKVYELMGKLTDLHFQDAQKIAAIKESLLSISKVLADMLRNQKMGTGQKIFSTIQSLNRITSNQVTQIVETAFSNYGMQGEKSDVSLNGTKEPPIAVTPLFQTMSRTEQFTLFVSSQPRPMNFEQFVEKFSHLLAKSQLTNFPNGNKLLIKLYPEHLGSLRIELLQKDGMLTARILASSQTVKNLLDSQLHSLKTAFTSQNIQVDKLEVNFNGTDPQKFDREPSQQQSNRENQRNEEEQNDRQEESNKTNFKEMLLNVEV
ncbi:flagellar hook-length control protein FliK [Oikeobacillus pervagus]|uniref:Flagellar hook-length control protein FliK n=1 Tax=Oikeobacillus pervagus TaxID=1325931 RepID=A0AAJ1SWS9_9BACI|nr:flagellar hook-length control protein FliK [Oikeobacillus pervagus]MDQ0214298.1 flagellar hook-length control protein FliK [Oikeobacillus pervagus]